LKVIMRKLIYTKMDGEKTRENKETRVTKYVTAKGGNKISLKG